MLKRDLIMVQIEELGKVIAQIISNRNGNADGKNPELVKVVYETLKLDSDFLMTTTPEDILRFLDNEDKGGMLRLDIAVKTLIEESYFQPEREQAMLHRATELLIFLQAHDNTFSLERINMLNEIRDRMDG